MQEEIHNAGSVAMDRRQELRHLVERPCRVASTALPEGGITGVTANVSRSGMLVRFPGAEGAGLLPMVGEPARIVMDLPSPMKFSPRALECVASAVRVLDPEKESPAVAFEIYRMKIRSQRRRPDPGVMVQ
jgi:hypothetical protein